MSDIMSNKEKIARRAARELQDGAFVNLGAGLPIMVSKFIPREVSVYLHAENGVVGVAMANKPTDIKPYLFDAGENDCTVVPGGAIVDSATSFGLVRGGHLDMTLLGTMQVDAEGSMANWMVPGGKFAGMGGAMDLVVGGKKVVVTTEHCSKDGKPKIVERCSFPLTGYKVADRIITEIAVIDVTEEGLVLREVAPGVTVEEVQEKTGAPIKIAEDLCEIVLA